MPLPALLATAATNIGNASSVASGISGIVSGVKSLFGKPKGIPAPLTGTEAGLQKRQELDAAFPGTTAWERLGSSAAGSTLQATTYSNNAQREQNREQLKNQMILNQQTLSNQQSIAEKNNRASIISSLAPYGPEGINYGLGTYSTSIGAQSGFDTVIKQNREKLPFEISKLSAEKQNILMQETKTFQDALKSGSEADIARAQARYADAMARAGLSELQARQFLHYAQGSKQISGIGTDIIDRSPMGWIKKIPQFDFYPKKKGR